MAKTVHSKQHGYKQILFHLPENIVGRYLKKKNKLTKLNKLVQVKRFGKFAILLEENTDIHGVLHLIEYSRFCYCNEQRKDYFYACVCVRTSKKRYLIERFNSEFDRV